MFSSPKQRFCHNCGTPQDEGISACTSCGALPQTAGVSVCRECGQENAKDSELCTHCGTTISLLPMVSFIQAINLGFKNYIRFNGRARRSEYWWFVLFVQVLTLVTWVPYLGLAIGLATLIPSISLTTRRLHDIGRSGWWQIVPGGLLISSLIFWEFTDIITWFKFELLLLAIVSTILTIIMSITFIIWTIKQGDVGHNKYGRDPRTGGLE